MYKQRWPLLYFALVSPVVCVALWEDDLENQTVNALEKVTKFYENHFLEINLDSLFGLRAAEGVLHYILVNRHVNHHDKQVVVTRMYASLKDISSKTLNHFRHDGGGYYHAFKSLVMKEWYYQANKRQVVSNLIHSDAKEDLDEAKSDHCMTSVMGTQVTGSKLKCSVSYDCWWWMSQIGATGYYLTHQALFFILADVTGCTHTLEQKFQYDKEITYTRLGTNIFAQMRELSSNGFKDAEDKDLFLEQALICKWLGVSSCLQNQWIRLVLSWQHTSGCIKDDENEMTHVGGMRRLNVEKVLSNGCSAHATGLFIAYLATAFHWLVTKHTDNSSLYSRFSRNLFRQQNVQCVFYLLPMIMMCLILLKICTRRRFKYRLVSY